MKKLRYIIPVILIVISLIGSYMLTVYASPYRFYKLSLFDDSGKYLNEDFANTYSILEKAYDISPNESVLCALSRLSCPGIAAFQREISVPDDFYKKCEIYNRETIKRAGILGASKFYTGGFDSINLDKYIDWESTHLYFTAECNLAYALFMQGKTEEAKQVIENYIMEFSDMLENNRDNDNAGLNWSASMRFFDDTQALSMDKDYKDWVTEKEIEITKLYKSHVDAETAEVIGDNMYKNHTYEELFEEYNNDRNAW